MAQLAIMAAIAVGTAVVSHMMTPKPKLQPVDKGRSDDVRIQYSEFNGMMPFCTGRARFAGNVFWSDQVQEHLSVTPASGGGKGGGGGGSTPQPETRNYSYTTSLAIGICVGPVHNGIRRVWDGADLITNRDTPDNYLNYYEAEAATRGPNTGLMNGQGLYSGGQAVSLAKTSIPPLSGFVQFNAVRAQDAGTHTLTVHYVETSTCEVDVEVNGVAAGTFVLTSTGGAVGTDAMEVELNAGTNTVKLTCASSGQATIIDRIAVTRTPDMNPIPVPCETRGVTGYIDENIAFPENPDEPCEYYQYQPPVNDLGTMGSTVAAGGRGTVRFYNGGPDQEQDPKMVAVDGARRTPAYNNICYAFIEDYTLPGGAMRQWTFEVDEGTTDLEQVMLKLYGWANFDPALCDFTALAGITVPGLVVAQRTPLGEVVQSLATYFAFDVVDLDGKIVAVKRGQSSVVTIPANDVGLYPEGSERPEGPVKVVRKDVMDLPLSVNVGVLNPDNDYRQDSIPAQRQVGLSVDPATLNFPIVSTADVAAQVGKRWLFAQHLEREPMEFVLGPKYMWLAPCAVVTLELPTVTYVSRLTGMSIGLPGLINCKAVPEKASIYNQSALSPNGTEVPVIRPPANTKLVAFETPPLRLEDGLGYWLAACGRGEGQWSGSVVYLRQQENVNVYNRLTDLDSPCTVGVALDLLGVDPGGALDTTSSATVGLYYGTLSSITQEEAVANPNLNLCWHNGELYQFLTATPVALTAGEPYVSKYTVSNLLRARFQTTGAAQSPGGDWVLMNGAVKFRQAEPEEVGKELTLKAVSRGGVSISNASAVTLTLVGMMARLPMVSDLVVNASGSDKHASWKKGNRNQNVNYLGEDREQYFVEVLNGAGQAVRSQVIVVRGEEPIRWEPINESHSDPSHLDIFSDGTISTDGSPSTTGWARSQWFTAGDLALTWEIDGRLGPYFMSIDGPSAVDFDADPGSDTLTAPDHRLADGDRVELSTTGTLPAPLAPLTLYYLRDVSGPTFKLASSPGGPAIDITSAGTGDHGLLVGFTGVRVGTTVTGGVPYLDPEPPSTFFKRRQVPRERYAIRVSGRHAAYYEKWPSAQPLYRSGTYRLPATYCFVATLGIQSGEEQAALKCTAVFDGPTLFVYTSDMQVKDFGSVQATVTFRVRPISSVTGYGMPAVATG